MAFSRGARTVTHLFNAMRPVSHRDPGVAFAALSRADVTVQLIVDGHHLAPDTVTVAWRAAAGRLALVTDAIAAAGCAPGRYRIGGVECDLGDDGRVSLPGTPYLAGSSLTLDRAIANTVRFTGIAIDSAIAMASTIPASYIGMTPGGTITAEWDAEAFDLRICSVTS
jgi:N-acetylglucosamine-6-phosphate deacetylase